MDGRPENGRPFSCPDTLQKGTHLVEILPSRAGFDAAGDIDGGGIYLTHGFGDVFRCETAGYETPERVKLLAQQGLPVFKALGVKDRFLESSLR
jgi:hypothetical protein